MHVFVCECFLETRSEGVNDIRIYKRAIQSNNMCKEGWLQTLIKNKECMLGGKPCTSKLEGVYVIYQLDKRLKECV